MTERTGRSGPRGLRRAVAVLVTLVAVVAAGVVGLAVLPYAAAQPVSPGALTPDQAEGDYAALVARDRGDTTLRPECVSRDVHPTTAQQGVVLLYHGYSSCPAQLAGVADRLAAAGYRVLVPRWPGHGVAGARAEPQPVDAQALADFTMRTTAVALGLDRRTVLGGLAGGATLALWSAEHNAGVQRVVAVAPMLGDGHPDRLVHAAANAMRLLPDLDVGWDRVGVLPAPYGYPAWATRSVAGLLTLASTLGTTRANAYLVLVVGTAGEPVDAGAVAEAVARQREAGDRVSLYVLPPGTLTPRDPDAPDEPGTGLAAAVPALLDLLTSGSTNRLSPG